jgi:polyamine oxidase
MFAGEATEPDYFSTVHGAYLSGIRESNRVLSIISNDRVNSKI